MEHRTLNLGFILLLIRHTMALDVPLRVLDLSESMQKEERHSNDIYGLCLEFSDIYRNYSSAGLPDPEGYFETSYKWYNFVTKVYEELSVTAIQENRESYVSSDAVQVCHNGRGKWDTSGNDYFHLANVLPNELQNQDYQYFHTRTIEPIKVENFCRVLQTAFNETGYTVSNPKPQTLRISGDFLRLRDIISVYKKADAEGQTITAVEIFALNTLFMDEEFFLMSHDKATLVVIAPIWVIVSAAEIPETVRRPQQDRGWMPRLQIRADQYGSVIFGIGMKFTNMHGKLFLMLAPEPRKGDQVNLYQLVPENKLQMARTQHGETFLQPSIYLNGYDFHMGITDYLNYLLSNADSIRMKVSAQFLEKIYTYDKFALKMFNILGFVREIEILEDHFLELYRGHTRMNPVYGGLEKRFTEYLRNPKPAESAVEYMELRRIINTVIWSKKDVLSTENMLVINLESYLTTSVSDSIKLGDVQKREHSKKIMMYNKDMRQSIEHEMQRVSEFIDNEVLPQMKMMNQQLDMAVQQLLQKIIKLKEDVRENIEQRKKDEERLQNVKAAKLLFTVLACIGGALLALGTMGGGAFIWIGGASMVLSAGVNAFEDPSITPKIEMPPALDNVKQYIESKANTLDYLLTIIDDQEPKYLNDLKNKIKKTKEDLKAGVDNAPFVQVETYLKEKMSELNRMSQRPTNALMIVLKVQENLKVAQYSSADTYTQYYRNNTALQILSDASKKDEPDEIKAINEYERNVHALLVPAVKFLNNYTLSIVDTTDSQSLVAIDVSRWKAENIITSVKKQLAKHTEGLTQGQQMVDAIDRLERAINLVFTLLSRGAAYSEYLQLIDYIANVNAVPYQSGMSSNAAIADALGTLKYIARFNIAITQYKKALHSYRLFAFPFVTMVIGADNVDLDADRDVIKTTRDLASRAEYQLAYLSLKMTNYKTNVIGGMDINMMEGEFDGASVRRPVFYTWNFQNSDPIIGKLFNGESVELYADVTKGVPRNAVKFKRIGLRFKAAKPKHQQRLDAALEAYDVKITHSGESYFKCDDRYFMVDSPNMTFVFSFAKNADGTPTTVGQSYKKLLTGDFLLSPYTKWTVQIEHENHDFSPLANFKQKKLQLELNGFGQYVRGSDSCDKALENYYERFNP